MTNPRFTETPPHPTHDIRCKGCKHWLTTEAKLQTPFNGQWVSRQQLLEAGQNVQGIEFRNIAPCTHGPGAWTMLDSQHWCGQYESRDVRR